MIRAACIGAVVMAMAAVGIGSAHAQPTAPSANLDEDACARHLYERLAPLARGRHDGDRQGRIVLRAIADAEACGLPDEWRDAARRGARTMSLDDSARLFGTLTVDHPDEHCRTQTNERGRYVTDTDYDCRPAHAAVRDLVVSLGLERSFAFERAFLVLVIDTLTAASSRLVAAAQALWTFANWDFRCVPSPIFIRIRDDLRSGTARHEPYTRSSR